MPFFAIHARCGHTVRVLAESRPARVVEHCPACLGDEEYDPAPLVQWVPKPIERTVPLDTQLQAVRGAIGGGK